ncbi:MAG: hypothetical protein IRY87_33495 [Acetobacteraceae bacterium]|nr:hypothetical protein [Acetobacteraceae bacterium]
MAAYSVVKLFDLANAPDDVQRTIRPIALAHVSVVDASAIWEVTVGTYDWRDAAEEWALHDWMRENGATDGEVVLVKMEAT